MKKKRKKKKKKRRRKKKRRKKKRKRREKKRKKKKTKKAKRRLRRSSGVLLHCSFLPLLPLHKSTNLLRSSPSLYDPNGWDCLKQHVKTTRVFSERLQVLYTE